MHEDILVYGHEDDGDVRETVRSYFEKGNSGGGWVLTGYTTSGIVSEDTTRGKFQSIFILLFNSYNFMRSNNIFPLDRAVRITNLRPLNEIASGEFETLRPVDCCGLIFYFCGHHDSTSVKFVLTCLKIE